MNKHIRKRKKKKNQIMKVMLDQKAQNTHTYTHIHTGMCHSCTEIKQYEPRAQFI